MKHYGDIRALDGAKLPPVDCITGGSPCQDLSVAGKRAGLAGERSGLFMEQVRIVKEMRENEIRNGRPAELVRPRYMVWENVPGAFSSNRGKDFAAVLEETARIACPDAPAVPVPAKGWPKAGCLAGMGANGPFSIAWRVHDAQFWGVPQRRKRIALVADFGGLSAPEILFERAGLRGNFEAGSAAGKELAGGTAPGVGGAGTVRMRAGCEGGGGKGALVQKEKSGALGCNNDQAVYCLKGNAVDRDTAQNGRWENKEVSFTLDATDRHGIAVLNGMGGPREGVTENVTGTLRARAKGDGPVVAAGFRHKQSGGAGGIGWQKEAAPTLAAEQLFSVYDARGNGDGKTVPCCTGDHENRVTDYTALCIGNGQTNNATIAEQANTLDTMHDQQAVVACEGGGNMTIRRLTPLECERLQGFPDGWTDIGEWTDSRGRKRKTSDSARYKALGNSIALPFWFWLLRRISAQYERHATLGSLFDGIGGFPLCWERSNGQGTALWGSEIEEFPIAVTKARFSKE